jgi:hypothetical protein
VALRTRVLAALGGAYSLLVSAIYALAVTRRLPLDDLALLTAFNAGLGVALSLLGYITAWYSRVLAREPERFAELAGAGVLAAFIAWAALLAYISAYGRLDAAIAALGLALLLLNAWPAGAYLVVHDQRKAVALGYVGQTAKLAGALIIRAFPSAHAALAVSAVVSLPTALAGVKRPDFSRALTLIRELLRGAHYQTLSVAATAASSAVTYIIFAAGGSSLLAYSYVLLQIGKSVYPALAVASLMYGSLLAGGDKLRRVLLDGAVVMYIYLVAAAVVAKSPEWYLAVVRPSELGNEELLRAVSLNGIAIVVWGIWLHADTVLRGIEEKIIFTLRDRPARALALDLMMSPLALALTYILACSYSITGIVIASAVSGTASAAFRLWLLGRAYLRLLTQLYAPAAAALALIYVAPVPTLPYATGGPLETVATYAPNAAILAALVLLSLLTLSPPAREAALAAVRRAVRA